MAEAVFALDVESGGVVDGSATAASALENLKAKIEADQGALKELTAQMKLLQSGGSVNIAQFKSMKDQLEQKKSAIQKASTEYSALGGKLTDIGKKTKAVAKEHADAVEKVKPLSKTFYELGERVSKLGGPVGFGALGPAVSGIGALLASPLAAVAVGSIAATAAVIALGAALVYVGAQAAYAAFKMADAARTSRIFLGAVAGSEEAGEKLGDTIGNIAKDIPIAQKALQDIAVQLSGKGLKDNDLENALRGISRATAVLGASAGQKLQSVVEKSKDLKRFMAKAADFEGSGITLDDMANALAARAGTSFANAKAAIQAGSVDLSTGLQALDDATQSKLGDASDQMKTSLSSIGERANQVFGSIFDDINVEPVLSQLREIVDMFDADTEAGKALREIASSILQPLFDSVATGGPGFKDFLLEVIIVGLRIEITFLKARNSLERFLNTPVGQFARKFFKLGWDMMAGLAEGILANQLAPIRAVTTAIDALTGAANKKAERHSPSRVFWRMGRDDMAGYELGIVEHTPAVEKATVAAMGAAQNGAKAANENASGGPDASRSVMVHIGELHVNGVKGADDPSFEAKLVEVLVKAIAMSGAPEPASQ